MTDSLPDWAPRDIDLSKPSAARMYDYYLGGAHNFAVDRDLARKAMALVPHGALLAQANRAFLHRALRYLLDQGIRQFIDIGSGIPTEGNVHETVESRLPVGEGRVLYVDHDPVAVAHSQLILGREHPQVRVLQADLRRPQDILNSPERRAVIDLDQPVAVLMVAVLHFISESDGPDKLIRQFWDAVAPGSHLVVSHGTDENQVTTASELAKVYRSASDQPTFRSRRRVQELFDGWELVDPGVVWVPQWHPDWPDEADGEPGVMPWAAAVGRKPAVGVQQ